MTERVQLARDERGVATLTLNRPELHNAFDDQSIADLCDALESLAREEDVRAVVITGEGKSFSAGADLNWMRAMAGFDKHANRKDARRLAHLLRCLDELPKPTIARINGPAFGGGVGLIAACDVAIAASSARFALTEVRLGLVPAVISPYVVRAIGYRQARRYALTAEMIDAPRAEVIGLVHEVVPGEELDAAVERTLSQILKGGPTALMLCKMLMRKIAVPDETEQSRFDELTSNLIAKVRVSDEGQEGLKAFLGKRAPAWLSDDNNS